MKKSFRKGLETFPVDVDIFHDEKMIALMKSNASISVTTLFAILSSIYRNGYYIRWNNLTRGKICFYVRDAAPELIDKVLENLINIGFFDKETYKNHSILTSADIQQRFFASVSHYDSEDLPFLLIELPKKAKKSAKRPSTPEASPAETPATAQPGAQNPTPTQSAPVTTAQNDSRIRVTGYRPVSMTLTHDHDYDSDHDYDHGHDHDYDYDHDYDHDHHPDVQGRGAASSPTHIVKEEVAKMPVGLYIVNRGVDVVSPWCAAQHNKKGIGVEPSFRL